MHQATGIMGARSGSAWTAGRRAGASAARSYAEAVAAVHRAHRAGAARVKLLFGAAALWSGAAGAQSIVREPTAPAHLSRLPSAITGRAVTEADGSIRRQWPGTYFETAFRGPAAFFRIGPGEVSLRVSIDAQAPQSLVKPEPGLYRITGLGRGAHRLRIDVASESQAGPTSFGGFFAGADTRPAALPSRRRRIEFIGDSHTVGYGNTSPSRACTEDQVWATTDTSRGLAAITAGRFGADYQVNAISGRGVVRNYNGFAADTLPQAYPFALFDHAKGKASTGWRPQAIVVALGTNDFSTPLNVGEKWTTRDQLHADYENSYVRFVQQLRARDPQALILLWAVDLAGGEIQSEVARLVDRLHREGDRRVDYVPVNKLAFSGCNAHPTVSDDAAIADALSARLRAHPEIWSRRTGKGNSK